MTATTRIVPLCDRPDLIAAAGTAIKDVWPDYYGPDGPGDARRDTRERSRPDGLPYGMLALADQDDVIGAGTLAGPSYGGQPGEDLWVIGLFVQPAHRGRGIATRIVQALEEQARVGGHRDIYTTTNTANRLLERIGWAPLRHFTDDTGMWQVLRKQL